MVNVHSRLFIGITLYNNKKQIYKIWTPQLAGLPPPLNLTSLSLFFDATQASSSWDSRAQLIDTLGATKFSRIAQKFPATDYLNSAPLAKSSFESKETEMACKSQRESMPD